MATAASLISIEEYLSHTYEPDCDYVDGHLEERNLGERDHSRLHSVLGQTCWRNTAARVLRSSQNSEFGFSPAVTEFQTFALSWEILGSRS